MDIKVRLNETDKLGHINNISYFIYLEEARLDFLESNGITTNKKEYEAFLLASLTCDFVRQGYFGEEFQVFTYVGNIGTKSMELISSIYNQENGLLIAKGRSVLVFFHMDKQISIPIPEEIKVKLEKLTYGKEEIE